MPYNPKVWQDRIVQKPLTYTIQNNPDGTITLVPAPGTITQEGTPVNATSMNNIENSIKDITDLVESDGIVNGTTQDISYLILMGM